MGGTDPEPERAKFCKYSPAQTPCVIRGPSVEDCRACLTALMERDKDVRTYTDGTCPECGCKLDAWNFNNLGPHRHYKGIYKEERNWVVKENQT